MDTASEEVNIIILEDNLIVEIESSNENETSIRASKMKEKSYDKLIESNKNTFSMANTTSKKSRSNLIKEYDELDEDGIYGISKEKLERIVDIAFNRD